MLRYAPRPRTRREGLTDDQSETISRAFVTFDSDRSGSIERNELEKVRALPSVRPQMLTAMLPPPGVALPRV